MKALTPRQTEAMDFIAQGLTDKEIARKMGISPDSVKRHVGRARSKLGARNRPHAIFQLFDLGLAQPHQTSH